VACCFTKSEYFKPDFSHILSSICDIYWFLGFLRETVPPCS
jgi:hypothetical protein